MPVDSDVDVELLWLPVDSDVESLILVDSLTLVEAESEALVEAESEALVEVLVDSLTLVDNVPEITCCPRLAKTS
ncbi:hypothetical protein [Leuconostoc sp. LN180020]|uniref:hypothetical protein n=1 Tax=Leuconostoc sp. LN180020 TaxID=2571156 RepID=UPI0035303198